jgi:hypothetical protein
MIMIIVIMKIVMIIVSLALPRSHVDEAMARCVHYCVYSSLRQRYYPLGMDPPTVGEKRNKLFAL